MVHTPFPVRQSSTHQYGTWSPPRSTHLHMPVTIRNQVATMQHKITYADKVRDNGLHHPPFILASRVRCSRAPTEAQAPAPDEYVSSPKTPQLMDPFGYSRAPSTTFVQLNLRWSPQRVRVALHQLCPNTCVWHVHPAPHHQPSITTAILLQRTLHHRVPVPGCTSAQTPQAAPSLEG